VVIYDHLYGVMIGRAAVFLFFVLSGFWIHRMWTERYAFCPHPYLTFLISRLWRLMPVMLVVSVMAGAVQWLVADADLPAGSGDDPLHVMASHLFLIGYSSLQSPRLVEPAWSLDLEMQFYLVAPLLVLALTRLGRVGFATLCVALILFDRLAGTPAALHALGWFAIGMLASACSWRPARRLVLASTFATIGLLFVSALGPILTDPSWYDANTRLIWILPLLAAPVALHTCFVEENRRDRLYGNLSYVLYLVHWPLMIWAQYALSGHPLARLATVVLVILLGLAIWHGVDRPMQRLRARWVQGRLDTGRIHSARSRQPHPLTP
jgi:peptidoglycan/LPS O-acetylase OafA/YrhL